jgi:hypothetical protein
MAAGQTVVGAVARVLVDRDRLAGVDGGDGGRGGQNGGEEQDSFHG